MNVSWRHMLAGAGVAVLAATGLTAMGEPQCGTCAPPSPPPPPPPSSCCQTPSNVVVSIPGVNVAAANVRVGASSSVIASAGASTMASGIVVSGAGASGGAYAIGGGGGYYNNPGVASSSISGLQLDGGYETKTVEEEVSTVEGYCIDKIIEEMQTRPVQAMCVDDKGVPHPASRLSDGANVDANFSGEIYRCIAGTHMQVTLGKLEGKDASFSSGETFECAKGESLWHGKGGALSCKTQTAERNCNERSLLRKYGPGVKLVTYRATKNVCEPAERTKITKVAKTVKVPRAIASGDLQLDGGVGQGY